MDTDTTPTSITPSTTGSNDTEVWDVSYSWALLREFSWALLRELPFGRLAVIVDERLETMPWHQGPILDSCGSSSTR